MNSDEMSLNFSKHKKNIKKGNKKFIKKELQLDIDFFEYQKRLDDSIFDYKNIQYLSQKDKTEFDNKFSIPRNESQKKLLAALKKKDYKIIIASGPAGTGKTLFGIEQGIKNFVTDVYEKMIFTRPMVSVDEDIGYLPGTLEDKMGPWMTHIFDIVHNFILPSEVKNLLNEKIIEIVPLGFLRGRTFKNCWIVADEMQNSTVSQMKMLLTRLGENSKLIITGDIKQADRKNEINGLEDFLNRLRGHRSESISSIEFENKDIEREDIVKEVLEIYETNINLYA
jgi:phosphate starvation-inducible PhoH-like protein